MLIFDDLNVRKYRARWADAGLNVDIEMYVKAFLKIKQMTNVVNLRDFQYRLLLGKLVTRELLLQWGKTDDALCNFCKKENESVPHVLYDCMYARRLIEVLVKLAHENDITLELTRENNLLYQIVPKTNHVMNYLVIVLKQYLYRNCCQQLTPNKQNFQKEVIYLMNIDRYNAVRSHNIQNFYMKWGPLLNEQDNDLHL